MVKETGKGGSFLPPLSSKSCFICEPSVLEETGDPIPSTRHVLGRVFRMKSFSAQDHPWPTALCPSPSLHCQQLSDFPPFLFLGILLIFIFPKRLCPLSVSRLLSRQTSGFRLVSVKESSALGTNPSDRGVLPQTETSPAPHNLSFLLGQCHLEVIPLASCPLHFLTLSVLLLQPGGKIGHHRMESQHKLNISEVEDSFKAPVGCLRSFMKTQIQFQTLL